ncbi:hypothetical protein GCM10022395_18370 [Snuella lapsa]|uniref:Uncharacterized protein n=1 Tax=Snuella lapsa TaxID=870481 RepID=A0ABP6XL82_9FLAO
MLSPSELVGEGLEPTHEQLTNDIEPQEAAEIPIFPFPLGFRESGLYIKSLFLKFPRPLPLPMRPAISTSLNGSDQVAINLDQLNDEESEGLKIRPILLYEEFRLDVDGLYPQMMASGYFRFPGVHYIAKLSKTSTSTYVGKIWYRYGNTSSSSFPYTKIEVEVNNALAPSSKKAKVKFTGPGGVTKTSTYTYRSKYFRDVNLEYDCEQGVTPILGINTHEHPNRPPNLNNENITLDTIFRRAGFNVTRAHDNVVPSSLKGSNGQWSNMELHDAMQIYWSKFANAPNWALWTFFAKQHESGSGLGGIMFDSIGPNHRQGTAIFYDSFINNVPNGESNPSAYRRRMKFWTAAHEMGHAFNLAHSWQKSLGTPWIPLANEPEARSFMNYPYFVSGGIDTFFGSFNYRFSNSELLFVRHAPNPFVQMGNSSWFVNHGFTDEEHHEGTDLKLEVRVNRQNNIVQYMEPVYIELKLTNTSGISMSVEKHILEDLHDIAIEIQKPNGQTELLKSFVTQLFAPEGTILAPNESIYHSFFISAGPDKWYIKESGTYSINAKLLHDDQIYCSNTMELHVLNPTSETQVVHSSQYFTDQVARVLYFNGSRVLTEANDTLAKVVSELPELNAAMHAAVALANPYTKEYNVLTFPDATIPTSIDAAVSNNASITVEEPNAKIALDYLLEATKDMDKFMDSYGHIQTVNQVDVLTETLLASKSKKDAQAIQQKMISSFKERGVLSKVIDDLENKLNAIKGK